MNYLVDYHMHSTQSLDGKSTIQEMCKSAVEKGLKEIAITDHFEPSKGDEQCRSYNQNSYWAEIYKAKQLFKGKLKIKLGVELGQPHLFQAISEAVISTFPYDYVIGSAHKMPGGKDVSQLDFENWKLADLCEMYLNQLQALVAWGKFDCVGHLDLIKRYGIASYKTRISLFSQYDLLVEVLSAIINSGKGIEINTSGLRQGPKEAMPGLDVIKLYRELGGEILTIGSDAHHADDVGKGLLDAVDMALEAGFRYITVYNQRRPEWKSITTKKTFQAVTKNII